MDYTIRPLTDADEPILWEMLFQALQNAQGEAALPRDIVRRPEFARYVEGWGRPGDSGFVAHDPEQDQLLGAVWLRDFSTDNPDVEAGTAPELAFAVKPGHRRRGIGAALLTYLVRANPQQSAITFHAARDNPAVRLYERFGFRVVEEGDNCVTMRREV